MNKTYSDALSKAEMLSEGISKNASELALKNIHIDTDKILFLRKELESAAQLQEMAERQLVDAREKAHSILYELKECCLEAKQPIKQKYLADSWFRFGLTDKR